MDVRDAVASRYSCRSFLPTPVPEQTVRDIIALAARAPSAGNMQPWRVYALAGERVEAVTAMLVPRMATELPRGEGTDYTIYPSPLDEPYKSRRFTVAVADIAAVDEELQFTRCGGDAVEGCVKGERCNAHDLWSSLGRQMMAFLASVSLEDVVEKRNLALAATIKQTKDRHPEGQPA